MWRRLHVQTRRHVQRHGTQQGHKRSIQAALEQQLVRADAAGHDSEHPDDGVLADVPRHGRHDPRADGAVPGHLQGVLSQQAQRTQAAVAAHAGALCFTCEV